MSPRRRWQPELRKRKHQLSGSRRWRALPALLVVGSLEARAQENGKCDYTKVQVPDECPSESGFDWEAFGESLYRSRSLVFLGDVESARSDVHDLLKASTSPFSRAFECPPAVAATYFSLAQILAFKGHLRRALAMVQMGFIFIRDKGFNECTPWPLQGWDMLLAGRNLAQRVRELDDQAVLRDTPRGLRMDDLRIAVVSICAYAEDEPVRVLSTQNHRLYTQLHGYDLHLFTSVDQIAPHLEGRMDVQDGWHKAFFWKVNAARNVLDFPERYDWILWADCDAFFMDPDRTIDSIIHMYTANLTIPTKISLLQEDEEAKEEEGAISQEADLRRALHPLESLPVSLLLAVDSTGINNGVWLLRNDDWARGFLDRWWHSDILHGPGREHNCSDQSTMQHQLLQQNAMRLVVAWDAAEGPVWPREVRVVAQEHLQSFHEATAASVLSREWQEGDFIKHHPGCHYYKEPCQQLYWQAAKFFEDKVRVALQRQALA